MLQTHENKTRQVEVKTAKQVTLKEASGPLKRKWKAMCLCNAQGEKLSLWTPLDNQSAMDLFGNKGLQTSIGKASNGVTAMTNSGELTTAVKGHLQNHGAF